MRLKTNICLSLSTMLTLCTSLFSLSEEIPENNNLMQNKIKYVVVVMMENRSFDNVLAWLYSQDNPPRHYIPQNADPHYMGLSDIDLNEYANPLKNSMGELVYLCPPIKGVPSVRLTNFLDSPQYDPYENFDHVTLQIYGSDKSNNPNMKGFLQDYASHWYEFEYTCCKRDICAVMETYTDKELPFLYGLASHYAVSDMWFSSVPTDTNPNRAFSLCGTSLGQTVNGILGTSYFDTDTIWNRLTEESPETSWSIYWQSDMVPFIIEGPFTGPKTFPRLNKIPNLASHFKLMDQFHEEARTGTLSHFSYIEPQWTNAVNIDPFVNSFAFKHNQTIDLEKLKAFVAGMQGNDMHPPGDVRTAENLLANIYTSLIANSKAWNDTLLIITFDEHGGIFDHIPPPSATPPDGHCQDGFSFDRFGVRIPTLFISPRIRKGTVIRSDDPAIPFDHTSLISSIFKWKNIDKSKWNMGKRTDVAPTFNNVVTLNRSRKDKVIIPTASKALLKSNVNTIQLEDPIYLKNALGNYLIKGPKGYSKVGPAEEKVILQFTGGTGEVTHGSFILLKSTDPELGEANVLEAMVGCGDCYYNENKHDLKQWWTIKSASTPYLGAPICYGDKIYLENHVYLDLFQLAPGRLVQSGFFGDFLALKSICDSNSEDFYWIIERPK